VSGENSGRNLAERQRRRKTDGKNDDLNSRGKKKMTISTPEKKKMTISTPEEKKNDHLNPGGKKK